MMHGQKNIKKLIGSASAVLTNCIQLQVIYLLVWCSILSNLRSRCFKNKIYIV